MNWKALKKSLSLFNIIVPILTVLCLLVAGSAEAIAVAIGISLFLFSTFLRYQSLDSTIIKKLERIKKNKE